MVERSLRCARRHTFDIARHGYVNLAGRAPSDNADDQDMVRARAEFLDAGHYAPLAEHLGVLAARVGGGDGLVLDAGAGTGYYLAAVLDCLPDAAGLAMDVSTYALRRAARAHQRAGAVGWDVWRPLPVRDGALSLLLNVFAPRNSVEFCRVLAPDGALIVVTPTDDHLAELVNAMRLLSVDARKRQRLDQTLSADFRLDATTVLRTPLTLSPPDVLRAAAMGPSARHVPAEELRRRAHAVDAPLRTTASFTVSVYRRRRAGVAERKGGR